MSNAHKVIHILYVKFKTKSKLNFQNQGEP